MFALSSAMSPLRDAPLLPRIFIRTLLRTVYADKEAGEVRLTFRPPALQLP